MFRDHRAPAGPRPANASRSPTRPAKENINPISNSDSAGTKSTSIDHDGPMLSASSSNNHTLFSFGRHGGDGEVGGDDTTTASFEFLPSVSFDDLQSSIESASTEFKLTQFPSPTGQGSILDEKPLFDKMAAQQSSITQSGNSTRVAAQPNPTPNNATAGGRPFRSGSILRRPSQSNRQPSIGSNAGGAAAALSIADAPTAPAAMRNRRQSHYPPVSNTNTLAKAPRKSMGSAVTESDYGSRLAQKRRPSLMSTASERDSAARTSTEIFGGSSGDATRNPATSRTTKARSVQPPPRISATNFSSSTGSSGSQLTPDGTRKSVLFPRSPRVGTGTTGTPGSGRRASVMPGHASGLGARTISPTDAQRMKRMSMHQSQSLSQVATPQPVNPDARPHSRSPSMIPRKTSTTPSSLRTTPDPPRKSYSSGLSVASNISFNTNRTSTGSIQPGATHNSAISRLPAPKATNNNNNNNNNNINQPPDDDEDVPPVPAIPKAYESPKDSPAELAFMEKKKQAFDASSIHSNSTGTLSNAPSFERMPQLQRKPSARKPRTTMGGAISDNEKKIVFPNPSRKNPPVRLPPMNLGPLSTPTAAKIAALKDQAPDDGKRTPPARIAAKTPTTPMTASKSSFFSRGHKDRDPEKPTVRSSTSAHQGRLNSDNEADFTSSSDGIPDLPSDALKQKPSMSPFLSTSLPKSDSTFGANLAKAKANGNNHKIVPSNLNHNMDARQQPKPSGPRAPKLTQTNTKSPPPASSPEEPPTPSSMSTLRRKLSLSWKRSTSKSSSHPSNVPTENGTSHVRQESMPPPRIPISATLGSMKAASPSHTSKPSTGSYLDTRRRKSSASSLTAIAAQEKSKNESWVNAKKTSLDVGNSSMIETSTTSTTRGSTVQRLLRPRPSTASIKQQDGLYVADLDKDDMVAEDEMKKLASRRKETEMAAKTLDALRKRASPKERVGPQEAIRIAMLNIYERGEIVDYNDVYFCGTQNAAKVVGDLSSSAPNFGYDDDRGDYSIIVGDHLAYRYEIVDVLGKGSFGQVVRCIDHKTGVLVAVKIIRNKKRFHQQALVEVNILQKIREWDPRNKHSMVNFTHSFYFRGHLCISTELLDMNLYEFIKSNNFRGFSLKLIRRFTKQMLSSLHMLKQHKVIHCDLKPENILLRHPMHSEIKVIDFGSSCFENEKVYTYIQSRFYRSPEVILGMTYGLPIDMWSVGCILAELYTGVPIFPGENEQEQLACIMEIFGPPEKHLIEKSTRKKLFFDSMGKPRLTVSSKGRRRRPSSKTLQQVLKCDDEFFLDFLTKCLRWDPDRRIKPEEAVRHEFITGQKASVHAPRAAVRDQSPMKRHNTVSMPRPLPDPPATNKMLPRTGPSPHKPPITTRRASGITGPFTSGGIKRTSTGQSGISAPAAPGSSLPRIAGRSVSAKQDLASAGATAAMSRRV